MNSNITKGKPQQKQSNKPARNNNKKGNGRKYHKDMYPCSSEPRLDAGKSKGKLEDIHSNDISWWNQSPLYNDATSIPQNRFPGYFHNDRELLAPRGYGHEDNLPSEVVTAQPGVMIFEYIPTIGYSDGHTSPINRSFTSLYAQIAAHTNSGNLGFTQASLAMMTISAYSIATNIGMAKRLLGLRRVWDNSNANLPRGLMMALGQEVPLSEIDWEAKRVQLNTLIDSFNALQIPRYVSILDRAFQLGYNIYADEDSTEAQFYAFKAQGLYLYKDTENKAQYMSFYSFISEYQDEYDIKLADMLGVYLAAIDQQLRLLRSTSDLGIIMGAFRRAFPASAAMVFDYVQADEVIIPWFDRNMLWQINNMDIIEGAIEQLDVKEDVAQDYIICTPIASGTEYNGSEYYSHLCFNTSSRVLNSFNGEWNDEFIMEATRLKVIVERNNNPDSPGHIKCCGTEIVTKALVYQPRLNAVPAVRKFMQNLVFGAWSADSDAYYTSVLVSKTGTETTAQAFPFDLVAITKFRNRPLVYVYSGLYAEEVTSVPSQADIVDLINTTNFVGVMGDLYKYAVITKDQLEQLHLAALQSAYLVNIPTNW